MKDWMRKLASLFSTMHGWAGWAWTSYWWSAWPERYVV